MADHITVRPIQELTILSALVLPEIGTHKHLFHG